MNSKDGLGNLTQTNARTSSDKSDATKRKMTSDEREILQDILVEYIENPRKMGTCIKDIETLFQSVHQRWSKKPDRKPTITDDESDEIINTICDRYDISYEELIGKRRSAHLITAREQICYAMHRAGYNYSQIGRVINRHASTVIHTLKKEIEE